MGSRKGGIANWSIRKLGTPSGAGPKSATVRVGLALVGTPLGLRVGWSGAGVAADRSRPTCRRCRWPRRRALRGRPDPPGRPVRPAARRRCSRPFRRCGRRRCRRAGGRHRRRCPPPPGRAGGGWRSGGGGAVSDSSVSSGPEQPGSERSVRPSPSLSFKSEQAGWELTGGWFCPPGGLCRSAVVWRCWALTTPAVIAVPRTASATVSRSFRRILSSLGSARQPEDLPGQVREYGYAKHCLLQGRDYATCSIGGLQRVTGPDNRIPDGSTPPSRRLSPLAIESALEPVRLKRYAAPKWRGQGPG